MQQVLIYIGLTLVVVGCVIGMYGGFKWKSEQTKTPPIPEYLEALKHKYSKYRLTWLILAAAGCAMVFIATYIR